MVFKTWLSPKKDLQNPRPKIIQRCINANLNNNAWKRNEKPPHPVKLTKHRIMSSRTLREDTEKIRMSLSLVEGDSEFVAAIKGEKCKENSEMLNAIAITEASQSSESIMDHILSEGVNCSKIKAMGGLQHLICFDTIEDKKSMIEGKWLERWFIAIRNVNSQSAALWRESWRNIYGVPLIAWGHKFFFDIGCIFGCVISVNYKDYDSAQLLVYTYCLFDINCKISLEIDDKKYPIFISEKKQLWLQNSDSITGVKFLTVPLLQVKLLIHAKK